MNGLTLLDGVFKKFANVNDELIQIWISHIVFSWRWWLATVLTILPWIVWIKIRDKRNTARLFLVGLIVIITTSTFDVIGIALNLWHYDWMLLPFIPVFIPWDYTLFPVSIMLIIQFNPKLNGLIKAIAFAFTTAFIMEPLFNWLALYDLIHWKFMYSFIIYAPLFLIFNYIYKCNLFNKNNSPDHS